MKANVEIREKAKNSSIRLWQIAEALGIHESLFSKKLRRELPQEEKEKILGVIAQLAQERREAI